jgi:hypothetical protein
MVLGLVFTPLAWGQGYQYAQVFDNEGVAAQYETLTPVASTGFTSSKSCVTDSTGSSRVCAKAALISVETGGIRFTLEGTTPTTTASTSVGHLMAVGDSYVIRGFENIQNFKCIQAVTATGGVVKVTYFY